MAESVTMNPVGWFEIYVDDMNRAKKFYETVLDKPLSPLADPTGDNGGMEMMAFPMAQGVPNASGALVKMEGMDVGKNSVIVYFSSDDCAVEEGRVEGAGGKIMKPRMSIGEYGFISLCFDTEGNIFGIHSRN